MKISNSLANAIDNIDAPPCVGCIMLPRCAALRLACDDFRHYISPTLQRVGERNRIANRKLFIEIYEREDDHVQINGRTTPRHKPTNRDSSSRTSVGRWKNAATGSITNPTGRNQLGEGASGEHVLDQRRNSGGTNRSAGIANGGKLSPQTRGDYRKGD